MKFDQLVYFLETARFQHIGKASRSLHISPSAVSHAIRNLEDELGLALFEKVGKSIYLTPHGKRLAERAEDLLCQMRHIKTEIQSDDVEWEGKYRVGTTHGIGDLVFLPRWTALQKKHPGLQLESYSLRSAQIVELTAKGELDLGICISPLQHPQLEQKVLRSERLLLAVRRDHPVLKLTPKEQAARLSQLPSASPKAFSGIEICEQHPEVLAQGIQQNISFIFDSYLHAIRYLQEGDGWALLPELLVQQYKLGSVTFKNWRASVAITAIWPKGRPLARVLDGLLEEN